MATCSALFEKHNESLRLDVSRRGRIESAVKAFVDFAKSDDQLSAAIDGTPFLQGSIATRTSVRPLGSDEFDVDVVYPFRLSAFGDPTPSPNEIIQWFKKRLCEREFYRENFDDSKDRCARIDYAGDFHVDFVPSAADIRGHQPYAVPARDLGAWTKSNPIGFADWVEQNAVRSGGRDVNGDYRFTRCVRYLKRWRDHTFPQGTAPSSMLLTTMLGKHEPHLPLFTRPSGLTFDVVPCDASYVHDILLHTIDCIRSEGTHAFLNPTVDGENLSRGWAESHLQNFVNESIRTISAIRRALAEPAEIVAAELYREAFGDSFPTS